jgi:hypothetical protein
VQITSLTDFPFKLTPVYIIKVAFRLENRDRTREHPDGKEGEGQFGSYQDDSSLASRSGGLVPAAMGTGFVYPKQHEREGAPTCGLGVLTGPGWWAWDSPVCRLQ